MSHDKPDIRFYHLERQSLDQALPGLLQAVIGKGHRVHILFDDESLMRKTDDTLWTYSPHSFLPHGCEATTKTEPHHHPIWLSQSSANVNEADVLVITQSNVPELLDYTIVCYMFDAREQGKLEAARAAWKSFKDQNAALTYWQQSDQGWKKKA